MTTNIDIKGNVHFVVRDKDGNIKQEFENHNIVVTMGDNYIADQLLGTPTRSTKVTRVGGTINAYMTIGSGWTGISPKTNTWVNTALSSGTVACADPSPVRVSGTTWNGVSNTNVIQYTTTGTGFTGVTGTANEIVLASTSTYTAPGATDATGTTTIAYAQITPSVTLTPSDTLSVTWAITFSGS